jgi:hypothetical protein
MKSTNQSISKITFLKERIKKELATLTGLYLSLRDEIDSKFKEELRNQKGDYSGLEDFYALVMMIKKDANTSAGALNLIRRLNDVSDFNVSDIQDNIELEKIFE